MLEKIRSVKSINIAMIFLYFFNISFAIISLVFYLMFINKFLNSGIETVNSSDTLNYSIENFVLFLIFIILAFLIGIPHLVLKIILLVDLNKLKRNYPQELETIWVLKLIGLFTPFLGIISAIILWKKIKTLEIKAKKDDISVKFE